MTRVPNDVIAVPERAGWWLLMNVFARTSLAVDSQALVFLGALGKVGLAAALEAHSGSGFEVCEVERFSNLDGLLADPTRYVRDVERWLPEQTDVDGLLGRLRKHALVVDDEVAYRARFAPKRSLLDFERFGNFHQQLGQQLLLLRRQSAAAWWVHQKFADDLRSIRDNLYRAVQEHYLSHYFRRRFGPGDVVVDVGCGTGYYSNLMASTGASVLGVDPSEEYISLAREHGAPGAQFAPMPVGAAGGMDAVPSGWADYVFMSDALLFYFVPVGPSQTADLDALFADIRRILKPGGRFVSLEPHCVFFLQPWLGAVDRPFTVVSEYQSRTFGITPSLSQLIQAYARGGFVVEWMDELLPDPEHAAVDPRATAFATQFPLWHLFELGKAQVPIAR